MQPAVCIFAPLLNIKPEFGDSSERKIEEMGGSVEQRGNSLEAVPSRRTSADCFAQHARTGRSGRGGEVSYSTGESSTELYGASGFSTGPLGESAAHRRPPFRNEPVPPPDQRRRPVDPGVRPESRHQRITSGSPP